MNTSSEDNIYPVGTFIRARVIPEVPLVIEKYYQRIYYCTAVGNPSKDKLAYFERELIPPTEEKIL